MSIRPVGAALLLGAFAALGGCRKAKPEVQPTPSPTTAPSGGSPSAGPPTTPPASSSSGGATSSTATTSLNTLQGAIYFEYDQDALTTESQAQLDQKLAVLVANPNVAVRITGHADERGSDEYNLALGQRRAATVKRYLTDRGIADTRLTIVSMGEERPACTGTDEACWRKNRRAEFDVTGGSVTR